MESEFNDREVYLCLSEIDHCPIRLVKIESDAPSSCWKLEDSFEANLDAEDESPPVVYVSRPELSFLGCEKPCESHRETIMGLLEEDNGQPRDLPVLVRPWKGENDNVTKPCRFSFPNKEWKRERLDYVSTPSKIASKQPEDPQGKQIIYLDLRDCALRLGAKASVAYFLRSLFSSHQSTPWRRKDASAHEQNDCVILQVSSPAPELLTSFRVSDIAMDWSLYSIAQLMTPNTCLPWQTQKASEKLTRSVLLVYRRLPKQCMLSSIHPLDGRVSRMGCLWQARTVLSKENDDDSHVEFELQEVAPPYVNAIDDFPYLSALVEPSNLRLIQEEVAAIPNWTAWPEQQHYQPLDGKAPWHVFPLCYCFPANDVSKMKWVTATASFVPNTVRLLKQHAGKWLRTALFSRLDPEAVLEPHTGWQDLANHVYRVHLPLKIPSGGLCGTWVDGCVQTHIQGQLLAFDDSKIHQAFNYSSEERLVLILDVLRPVDLPIGTATGGHSEELDAFIAQMEQPR